jgi:hypothetical protein
MADIQYDIDKRLIIVKGFLECHSSNNLTSASFRRSGLSEYNHTIKPSIPKQIGTKHCIETLQIPLFLHLRLRIRWFSTPLER